MTDSWKPWSFGLVLGSLLIAASLRAGPPSEPRMQFSATGPEEARIWQREARRQLFSKMMGGTRPEKVPLDPRILLEERAEGLLLRELSLQSLSDRRIHAWLALPQRHEDLPRAGILALHGHGGTGEQVVRGEGLYWFGKALARKGYAVVAPDIGQHELQHEGWSLMGERTWDSLACLDYLCALPFVDPKRVGTVGLSLGGETVMYVAALDERIRLAVSSGWLTTVENMKRGHCPCWNFQGLEETFDFSDIFSCVAPRPLLAQIGEKERAPGGFPVPLAEGAMAKIKEAYALFDDSEACSLDVHGEGHVFKGEVPFQWIDRHLGLPFEDKKGFPVAKIEVESEVPQYADVPVHLDWKGTKLPWQSLSLWEVDGDDARRVPYQVEVASEELKNARLHWILPRKAAQEKKRSFELRRGESSPWKSVSLEETEDVLELLCRGCPVLRYHHAVMAAPEGADSLYDRSAFIHPLWSPAGEILTRIHPLDHLHHMGIWNPWTHTEFEGRQVDFWNLGKGEGTVRFVKYLSKVSGPAYGGFRALHHHVDLKAPGGEKVALHEVWDVKVWNVGETHEDRFLWDLDVTLRCATESPVLLKAYRYGGLGFRATKEWDGEGDYLTSEGKTRENGQGTRARWCLVYGPTDKGPAGVLFMSHPENREHPEPMRIWQGNPRIFFSFCPIQKKDWELIPGEEYKLRYRMVVYNGQTSTEAAERLWSQFTSPPRVSVTETN